MYKLVITALLCLAASVVSAANILASKWYQPLVYPQTFVWYQTDPQSREVFTVMDYYNARHSSLDISFCRDSLCAATDELHIGDGVKIRTLGDGWWQYAAGYIGRVDNYEAASSYEVASVDDKSIQLKLRDNGYMVGCCYLNAQDNSPAHIFSGNALGHFEGTLQTYTFLLKPST
ncbi:hypothetical protein GQ42DRAFT_158360 [Ramicandelaber brevisporus]|nr:hypothetical protein GQ42DRAFT_158360 [Ramicandelaber brevisporus]